MQDTYSEVAIYDGLPLLPISHDALLRQGTVADTACYYVWPYEGQWRGKKFIFHKGTYVDHHKEIEYPTKPMLVDVSSARAYKIIYDALNDTNRAKLRGYVEEHRGLFFWAMDQLVWPHVGFGRVK